jgi:hypothetical protein
MTYRKKLIEVALPLDAINKESAREKSIRTGIRPRRISGGEAAARFLWCRYSSQYLWSTWISNMTFVVRDRDGNIIRTAPSEAEILGRRKEKKRRAASRRLRKRASKELRSAFETKRRRHEDLTQ